MELITDLPLSNGCNAVLTYVDCLTKLYRLTPCFISGSYLDLGEVAHHFVDSVV